MTGPTHVLYGIPTCDTCRRAVAALRAAGRAAKFRDIRNEPLSTAERAEFVAAFGPALVNRASATWRGLAEADRALPPEALLAAHPTVMKRPVIRHPGGIALGWGQDAQAAVLQG